MRRSTPSFILNSPFFLISLIDLQKEAIFILGIGSQELMIIFLIAFLVFGAKRFPELAGSLGRAIRAFKNGMKEEGKEPDSKGTPDGS